MDRAFRKELRSSIGFPNLNTARNRANSKESTQQSSQSGCIHVGSKVRDERERDEEMSDGAITKGNG